MKRWIAVASMALALAGACRRRDETPANLNAANKVAVRTVRLYFESPGMLLVAEPRSVALPESPAAAMPLVMRELMKGPVTRGPLRILPPGTTVRGAYMLPGGTAVVDLGGPALTQGWGTGSHQELMAAYSIVQTVVANFPEVRRTHLLVNGAPAETLGGHVSLMRPLTPITGLIEPASR